MRSFKNERKKNQGHRTTGAHPRTGGNGEIYVA
nr:MAG TPA: hypothetical protein [Caudoviricetes sp.]